MTNRTAWPTVASGDAWTASQHNTYGRDNDLAYWVFTQAGDMAYATSSAALARLAIGAAGTVMTSTGSAPQWSAKSSVAGLLHVSGSVDFAPAQTFAGDWADITGATVTLTTSVTCTILLLAAITGYNTLAGAGRAIRIRGLVAGSADGGSRGGSENNGSANPPRNEGLFYQAKWAGVVAAANVCKLQCKADTDSNVVTSGRLIALAFPE